MDINFKKLKEPFSPDDIEFRVQRAGAKSDKPWAMVLAYVTNRAIMTRLDDVCGPEHWKNEFSTGPDGGVLCGISIRIGDEWVTKYDGADKTQVEAVKGGLSGAMKRAAVQWGIGRYLYGLDATFAEVSKNGKHYQPKDKGGKYPAFKWDAPRLPAWALPDFSADPPTRPKAQPAKPKPKTKQPEEDTEAKFLDLFGDLDGPDLDTYLNETARKAERTVDAVKASALKKPDAFRTGYERWQKPDK